MSKEKKPGPLEGLSPQERLERYVTLFAFTTEDEIDTERLAEQWDADQRGVASMIRYAKTNANLYAELRSLYEDADFPGWWYSPARNTDADERNKADADADRRSTPDAGADAERRCTQQGGRGTQIGAVNRMCTQKTQERTYYTHQNLQ